MCIRDSTPINGSYNMSIATEEKIDSKGEIKMLIFCKHQTVDLTNICWIKKIAQLLCSEKPTLA